jgi:RNA polymerase sigma-70 factor (ECF subfamily)
MPGGSRSDETARVLRDECLTHVDALYGAALRMTGNRQDAEDLVQETYLKAVRGLDRHREIASIRGWLFRILTNTYIDRYRKARRSPSEVPFEDEGPFDRAAELDDHAGLDAEALLRDPREIEAVLVRFVSDDVKAAVDELPEQFRLAVVLRDLLGLSYKEMSEQLSVPIGTVMSRLFRGRRMIQEHLREHARERA